MRLILPSLLMLILSISVANAQSIMDNLPSSGGEMVPEPANPVPAPVAKAPVAAPTPSVTPSSATSTNPYTVTDVNADVTADTAAHARDQALTQAEHTAFTQLCARLNTPDSLAKLSDDAVAALVQSFDVQSEHLSAVRYIGVFTIHFKPISTQKKLGKYLATATDASGNPVVGDEAKAVLQNTASHLTVAVQTSSLPAWTKTKNRLNTVAAIVRVDTLDLGRGTSHIDLLYAGGLDDLQKALTQSGFVLTQASSGEWQLIDNN